MQVPPFILDCRPLSSQMGHPHRSNCENTSDLYLLSPLLPLPLLAAPQFITHFIFPQFPAHSHTCPTPPPIHWRMSETTKLKARPIQDTVTSPYYQLCLGQQWPLTGIHNLSPSTLSCWLNCRSHSFLLREVTNLSLSSSSQRSFTSGKNIWIEFTQLLFLVVNCLYHFDRWSHYLSHFPITEKQTAINFQLNTEH